MNFIQLTLLPHNSQTSNVKLFLRVDQIVQIMEASADDKRLRPDINSLVTVPAGTMGVRESAPTILAKIRNADLEGVTAEE
jgi:hypothetical protein